MLQLEHRLDEPLPIGVLPEDESAVVILDGARNDLGCGSALPGNENDHGEIAVGTGLFGEEDLIVFGVASTDGDDFLVLLQEDVGNGDRLVQESPRVAAKIHQQPVSPRKPEFRDGVA